MTRHYRGTDCIDLTGEFPFAREMDPAVYGNPPGHTVLCDPELFDRCGYATADEGGVLAACARAMPGRWLEIGSHTGWTAAHLLAGGATELVALEPEFSQPTYNKTGDAARFLARFMRNVPDLRARPMGVRSEDYLTDQAGTFDGAFIDGEHEPPFPVNDAALVLPRMNESAVVIFHDTLAPQIQAAVRFMVDHGFRWRLYRTAQLLGVCWRGDFVPPAHRPDPGFNWDAWLHRIKFDTALLARQSL